MNVQQKLGPLVLMFLPTSRGLNVFIPLYNSLYIKYNFPIVYSCNIVVGDKWFWMDWTFETDRNSTTSNQEPTGLYWSGAQIGDSSEEVEKWAENPDLGSPNIQ